MPNRAQAKANSVLSHEFNQVRDARAKRAIEREKITVFLSHLEEDVESACLIRDVLQSHLSNGHVKVWLDRDIPKGRDWLDELKRAVNRADWFILLYSGAAVDWAWCHEETGAFLGSRNFDTDKLIVLHPKNVPLPSFLGSYQSVACPSYTAKRFDELAERTKNILELNDFRDIGNFLEQFFAEEPYPGFGEINSDLLTTKENRDEVTRAIVTAVGRMIVATTSLRYTMAITVAQPEEMDSSFPDNTQIDPGTAGKVLFKTGDEPCSWPEFLERIDKRETSTRKVWRAIASSCQWTWKTRQLQPIRRIFRAVAGMERYRPFLTHFERAGDNSCTFRLAFIETVEPETADNAEARLVTSLTLAYRFRTQILDRFGSSIKLAHHVHEHTELHRAEGRSEHELKCDALHQIIQALDDIMAEAENSGTYSPRVADDFKDKDDRKWIASLFTYWHEAQKLIRSAAEEADQETLAEIIEGFKPVNAAFIEAAFKRVVELIHDRAEPDRKIPDLAPIRERLGLGKGEEVVAPAA